MLPDFTTLPLAFSPKTTGSNLKWKSILKRCVGTFILKLCLRFIKKFKNTVTLIQSLASPLAPPFLCGIFKPEFQGNVLFLTFSLEPRTVNGLTHIQIHNTFILDCCGREMLTLPVLVCAHQIISNSNCKIRNHQYVILSYWHSFHSFRTTTA